jgi:ABC-type sugar transport system ATPase subunit
VGSGKEMSETILEMKNISISFGGTLALQKVYFDCTKGEIHGLVGENGAGKSTLSKIIVGAYQADEGEIYLDRKKVKISSPRIGQKLGIAMVYQEPRLIPHLNVAENVFLGTEPLTKIRLIDGRSIYSNTSRLLHAINVTLDPRITIDQLGPSQQRYIEILKCLAQNAKIIIMDEPSSAFDVNETEHLFKILSSLRESGITIVYISHRLEEIGLITNRVTVLRNGEVIGTRETGQVDKSGLIKMMTGKSSDLIFPQKEKRSRGEKILSIRGLKRKRALHSIDLDVCSGEILGIAGLVGSGRTELARCIFGVDPYEQGEISIEGKKVRIRNPSDSKKQRVAFVTEDRREEGLIEILSIRENCTLPILKKISNKAGFIVPRKERLQAKEIVKKLDIRGADDINQLAKNISGGNQQKMVLGKWLLTLPRLIILDEPTRGIDVGAKAEIYSLMQKLSNDGVSILMISSELPEILGICDRILIMADGQVTGEFAREDATEEKILRLAHHEA